MGWVDSAAPLPLYPRERKPSVYYIGGWTGVENLSPTGIRSLDRLARSESLYRLRFPSVD